MKTLKKKKTKMAHQKQNGVGCRQDENSGNTLTVSVEYRLVMGLQSYIYAVNASTGFVFYI